MLNAIIYSYIHVQIPFNGVAIFVCIHYRYMLFYGIVFSFVLFFKRDIYFFLPLQVFSMALIYVSLDGDKWQEWPIKLSTKSEAIKDTAVNITINLKGRVGRYIKICLYFSARWILISEISFESGK